MWKTWLTTWMKPSRDCYSWYVHPYAWQMRHVHCRGEGRWGKNSVIDVEGCADPSKCLRARRSRHRRWTRTDWHCHSARLKYPGNGSSTSAPSEGWLRRCPGTRTCDSRLRLKTRSDRVGYAPLADLTASSTHCALTEWHWRGQGCCDDERHSRSAVLCEVVRQADLAEGHVPTILENEHHEKWRLQTPCCWCWRQWNQSWYDD